MYYISPRIVIVELHGEFYKVKCGFSTLLQSFSLVICRILYAKNMRKGKLLGISLGLMLGGAIGNFIDRVFRQEVVDFIHMYIFSYNFPVFNIADAALSIGVVLLIIQTFLEEKNEGVIE